MKKHTIFALIAVGIILGFLAGVYLYKINSIKKDDIKEIGEKVEDECTIMGELDESELLGLVTTNSEEEKISPNCTIVLKVYYTVCDHLIETRKKIEKTEVNMTEEELKEKFKDWEIQKFTSTEIVLYKETDAFCDQHFLLKERDRIYWYI